MDVNSKRFSVKSDGFGNLVIRDRNAPYHPHIVPASDAPSVDQIAQMNERDFDKAMSRLCYGA